jgi:hypothetical protein
MPLPNRVSVLKIHPAIGIARISPNPDYFVFGDTPQNYKSNGLIKRQGVRFLIVGYDASGREIAAYTVPDLEALGLRVTWRVRLANKKIARYRGSGRLADADPRFVIAAEARSDANGGLLMGRMEAADFQEGHAIPLGAIQPDGLFLPGQGIVYRKQAGAPLPEVSMYSGDVADNTCDGPVEAEVVDAQTGSPVRQKVLPAWLFVAPPDYSPDLVDTDIYPSPRKNLAEQLAAKLGAPEPVNQTAKSLDRRVLRQGTGDFSPGIETSIGAISFTSEVGDIKPLFLSPSQTGDPADIRLDPQRNEPGNLTAFLCSPWQFDFRACSCGYWAAQRPDIAFRDEAARIPWNPPDEKLVEWLRLVAASTGRVPAGGRLVYNRDFAFNTYKLGVIRLKNGDASVLENWVETERLDDIADVGEV